MTQGFPIGDDGRLMVPRQARVVDAEAPVAKDDKLKVEITRVCLESYMEVVIGNLQVKHSSPTARPEGTGRTVRAVSTDEVLNSSLPQDSIPKAIMLKLVNSVRKEKLSEYLNIHVNRPDMVEDLVQARHHMTKGIDAHY